MQGLSQVAVYIDDILVTGSSTEDHLKNLDIVMEHLASAGVTLKKSKCVFLAQSVEYLGHVMMVCTHHRRKFERFNKLQNPVTLLNLNHF